MGIVIKSSGFTIAEALQFPDKIVIKSSGFTLNLQLHDDVEEHVPVNQLEENFLMHQDSATNWHSPSKVNLNDNDKSSELQGKLGFNPVYDGQGLVDLAADVDIVLDLIDVDNTNNRKVTVKVDTETTIKVGTTKKVT